MTSKNEIKTENTNKDMSEEYGCLILKKEIKKKRKQNEYSYIKILPSTFFVLFLVVFCTILKTYAPYFYKISQMKHFFIMKNQVKNFPEYFDDNIIIKIFLTCSQVIFITIIIILTSLIRQRISVPELKMEKRKNYFILFSSIISVCSIMGLTFLKDKTMTFTRIFVGLTDNFLYISFLGSSISICYLSFILLKKIESIFFQKDSIFLFFKKIILAIMTINLVLYLSCLTLVSFYHPIIPVEQRFASILIILKEINSILFFINYGIYILTIKYDLYFVQSNLETRPDLQFFIDIEECQK